MVSSIPIYRLRPQKWEDRVGEASDPRFRVGQRHWFRPASNILNIMRPIARFMTVPCYVDSDDIV